MRTVDVSARRALFSSLLLICGLGCAKPADLHSSSSGATGGGGAGGATGGAAGDSGSGGSGGAAGTTTSTTGCFSGEECVSLNGPCVVGVCLNGSCTTQPANEMNPCEDGQFCTLGDYCQAGVCKSGPSKTCDGVDACHQGICEESTHTCIQQAANDGAQCDDKDPCSYFGKCQGGVCAKGSPVNCSYLDDDCAVGVCVPGVGCKLMPKNNGAPCEDGLFCTDGDKCQNGSCVGGPPLACPTPNGCFVATCDEANNTCGSTPGNDGAACDDGSPCTASTTCLAGVCGSGTPMNDGAACDDGSSCTSGETCLAGACTGGTGPTIYFADDFKDKSKGWTLGPEWQIGSAMMSIAGIGNPDPAMDHTPTNDNGIAGVEIGGDADTNIHAYYYMESPAFDASMAQGPVILGFYRWLNSDFEPYMSNHVDVFNGSQWINVWTSGADSIMDDAWTFQSYDLTAYKNASMRIRFGFNVQDLGVYTIGSWNIDDVLVASAACP